MLQGKDKNPKVLPKGLTIVAEDAAEDGEVMDRSDSVLDTTKPLTPKSKTEREKNLLLARKTRENSVTKEIETLFSNDELKAIPSATKLDTM